jgi:hypothetical protein
MLLNTKTKIKEFQVAHKKYKVTYTKDVIDHKEFGSVWGLINHDNGEVTIVGNRTKEDIFDTMLHEMFHAVYSSIGEGDNHETINKVCTLLAQALLTAR